MATNLQLSDAVSNAQLDALETAIGQAPHLLIYSGAATGDCTAPDPAGVLVDITLPTDWMTAGAGGVKTIANGPWTGTASGTGTAASFRVKQGTVCHIQGLVGQSSGFDLNLDNTAITAGETVTISVFTITTSTVMAIRGTVAAATTPPPVPTFDPTGLFLGNSFQGLSLAPLRLAGTNNAWMDIKGTDAKYGNVLPRAPAGLFGGNAGGTDSIQVIGTSPGNDIATAIVADTNVPTGVSTQTLQQKMVAAYNGSVYTQSSYIAFPSTGTQGMVYTSRWVWLQADTSARGPYWMELTEFKTPGSGCERFQVGITQASYTNPASQDGAHTPVFEIRHDMIGNPSHYYAQTFMGVLSVNNDTNYGTGQTHRAPVPLGRWFRLEFAFNRIDSGGQGWMWVALTDPGSADTALKSGTQVYSARGAFNHSGETLGLNASLPSAKIDRLFITNAYSNLTRSSTSPYVMKWTDIQVYTRWPSTATAHPPNYL